MRKSIVVLISAVLSVTGLSGTTLAVYNIPFKAKTIKTELVVAYNCTAPNATQFFAGSGVLSACTPPVALTTANPANVVTFGPKGSANITVSVGKGDIKIMVKSGDILNNGVPANAIGLGTVAGRVIATSGTCAPGTPPQPTPVPGTECTSTNISSLFSAIFTVPCTNGKCGLRSSVNTVFPGAITTGGKVNIEIGSIGLNDPDGNLAFTSGLLLP